MKGANDNFYRGYDIADVAPPDPMRTTDGAG
jgi:hypothetical protein